MSYNTVIDDRRVMPKLVGYVYHDDDTINGTITCYLDIYRVALLRNVGCSLKRLQAESFEFQVHHVREFALCYDERVIGLVYR